MTDHLTSQQVLEWRGRSMSAEELLRVDDHLAQCAECRALVAQGIERSVRQVRDMFSADHLTEAQLDDYALRRPMQADLMRHIDRCEECRVDAEDLRRHADSTRETGPEAGAELPGADASNNAVTGRKMRFPLRSIAAALAVAALGLSVWLALNRRRAAIEETKSVAGEARREFAFELPAPYREEIHAAMNSGSLRIPESIAAMAARPIQLRSAGTVPTSFHVVSPLATAVVEDAPVFRWTALDGATFSVSVYDDQFRLVTKSRPLKSLEWSPDKPLVRKTVYRWEVKAVRGGHTQSAPAPTEPEAKFFVLSVTDARRLGAAHAAMPDDPLAMGILYANSGVLDLARRELSAAALASDPARISLAERFLGQLQLGQPQLGQPK